MADSPVKYEAVIRLALIGRSPGACTPIPGTGMPEAGEVPRAPRGAGDGADLGLVSVGCVIGNPEWP